MKYFDNQDVHIGDVIRMEGSSSGVVVCNFEDAEFFSTYPSEEWDYIKDGILVDFDDIGLTHIQELTKDVCMILRSK
jgi:hypothetical protein